LVNHRVPRKNRLHRTRQLFIRQQTSVINAIRAHLAEFGIVAAVGRKGVEHLLAIATDASACLRLLR
jgi:transposase